MSEASDPVSMEPMDHIVVLTKMGDDGNGHGRIWYVEESRWQRIESLLPRFPHESALYTPENIEAAQEYREKVLLIDHSELDDDD